jgi:proton-translocating NADH-quinone oxidoreductase chain L
MYLLSIYFPFISFFICYSFGKKLGFQGVAFISCFCLIIAMLFSFFIFQEVIIFNYSSIIELGRWFDAGKIHIKWGFIFDPLASIMLLMILIISSVVHIYSFSYMQQDPRRNHFISLLSLFTFFMLLLITANSFLQLLLGWEGVGICSYLLVNFWSDRITANKAALKALFFNRVGDFGMVLALIILLDIFKTLNFNIVFDSAYMFVNEYYTLGIFTISKIDLLCSFIMLAAIAKSAQFFLHGWLADAMEGPTPVSALIHAATMVTAGIFLMARFSPILQYSVFILNIIIIFGVITTIIFSFSGQNTNDLKKIVASSTASQLAYMFFIIGLLDIEASIFHLFLHAFFKALLFLSAGSIIHGLGDQQDIRKMGGLFKFMPFNTFCFAVGSLSLIGLPAATGGYYSKDPIIEDTMLMNNYFDDFLNLGAELGVLNTLYYNLKLLRIVFFGHYKGTQNVSFHDSSNLILCCLFFLTICSFIAPLLWEFIISEDNIISQNFTDIVHFYKESDLNYYREEEISSYLFWLIILICIVGFIHSEKVFSDNYDTNGLSFYSYYNEIVSNDNVRWGLEYLMVKKFISFFFNLSDFFFFSIDRGFLEILGPLGLIQRVRKLFYFFTNFQSGFIYHYISVYFLGVSFFICYVYVKLFSFYFIQVILFLFLFKLFDFFNFNLNNIIVKNFVSFDSKNLYDQGKKLMNFLIYLSDLLICLLNIISYYINKHFFSYINNHNLRWGVSKIFDFLLFYYFYTIIFISYDNFFFLYFFYNLFQLPYHLII